MYLDKTRACLAQFKEFLIRQIPRSENSNIDALAKLSSTYEIDLARIVLIKVLPAPSIFEAEQLDVEVW